MDFWDGEKSPYQRMEIGRFPSSKSPLCSLKFIELTHYGTPKALGSRNIGHSTDRLAVDKCYWLRYGDTPLVQVLNIQFLKPCLQVCEQTLNHRPSDSLDALLELIGKLGASKGPKCAANGIL
ncbi:hypothetical protein SO802_032841 [Lithocarpus litseifolius]|uniref:Uncharacterized protein n=1 Tax=Lithocarpus litseifolius TaxID=425828 RepID=A0AAW2BBH8_9ROSI